MNSDLRGFKANFSIVIATVAYFKKCWQWSEDDVILESPADDAAMANSPTSPASQTAATIKAENETNDRSHATAESKFEVKSLSK